MGKDFSFKKDINKFHVKGNKQMFLNLFKTINVKFLETACLVQIFGKVSTA